MKWWEEYFADYYKLTAFSMDNEAKGEVSFILDQVELNQGSRVLDMCCGYGRHAIEMSQRGKFEIVGVDYSDNLIQLAKQKQKQLGLKNITFYQGDIRTFCPKIKFQLVLNLFISLGFFKEEDNQLAIKRLCEPVDAQGTLVLELHNHMKVVNSDYEKSRVPGGYTFETRRIYDQANKRLAIERTVTKKELRKVFHMDVRVYDLEEIVALCSQYGMRYQMHFGGYNGEAFDENAERLLLFLRKEDYSQ